MIVRKVLPMIYADNGSMKLLKSYVSNQVMALHQQLQHLAVTLTLHAKLSKAVVLQTHLVALLAVLTLAVQQQRQRQQLQLQQREVALAMKRLSNSTKSSMVRAFAKNTYQYSL
jgi:hypothetical protein